MPPLPMLSRLSISIRLALWYGLSLLLLLTLFVAGIYGSVHVGLHRDLDRQLQREAEAVVRHLQAHRDVHGAMADGASSGRTQTADGHAHSVAASTQGFVRLLTDDGEVVQTSERFPQPAFAPTLPVDDDREMRRHTWRGRTARTLYVRLNAAGVPGTWLEITRLESALHHQLHRLRWMLVVGVLLGSGGALGIGYVMARKALRPVAVLTEAARAMKDRPSGTLPTDFEREDELTDLAETFNDLLGRLRSTIARERRFRADAAHELSTPLTAIQSEVDVTLRGDRTADAYRAALEAVQRDAQALSSILSRLMTLSEVESRARGPAASSTDVIECLRVRIARIRPRAAERGIAIDGPAPGDAPEDAAVEPHHLDLIADHLLDNAVKYSADGEAVDVSVTAEDGAVCVHVHDTGMGFAPDEAEYLVDRFYRTGEASAQAPGGGLGLAIVQSIVHSYGGTLTAHSPGRGQGSTFRVWLPA